MFLKLDNTVDNLHEIIKPFNTIILVKPVQAAKTSDVLKIIEHTYKTSVTIFLSDKNTALAGQTNKRSVGLGWKIKDFKDANSPAEVYKFLGESVGKKRIAHFLMEVNNVSTLYMLLCAMTIPVTLVIDEGDRNRNVASSEDEDDEDMEETTLPPITRAILACKNVLKAKNNGSKTIFVTATPQGLLVSEKEEDRLVIYKAPYLNYVGAGLNHEPDLKLVNSILHNACKVRDRWTGNAEDRYNNSYYSGLYQAVHAFETLESKDTNIKQIMLVSLENRNRAQSLMAGFIRSEISIEQTNEIDVIIFNGETKDKNIPLLSDRIAASNKNKIVIVAGFMASRGVSFTDFSDADNKFELVIQVHAAKKTDPLNSALQNMRIFGPARRTISRPILFCNQITYRDVMYNFVELYRVIQDLAEGHKIINMGQYDSSRILCQKYNFRYMRQGNYNSLLFESHDLSDHEPITTL